MIRSFLKQPALCLLLTALLTIPSGLLTGVLTTAGAAPVPSVEPPPDEYSLVVLALGSWRGDFHVDARGRGGLAALHGYTRNRRRLLEARGGSLLLLQTGDFTGARTPAEFARALVRPRVNLPRYLGFDAFSLSADENRLLWVQRKRAEFRHFPGVSFNRKSPPAKAASGASTELDFTGALLRPRPLAPYRILARGKRNVFITSLTTGPAGDYEQTSPAKLEREMIRQSGTDLYVLMLQRARRITHDEPPAKKNPGNHAGAGGYFAATMPVSVAGKTASAGGKRGTMFPPRDIMRVDRVRNPYDDLKTFTPPAHTLIVRSDTRVNRFFRLVNGAFVCEISGRTLCEITFRFRDRRIIDVQGRFINLNGADQASAWIAPDRLLMDVLKKSADSGPKKGR